MSTMLRTLWNTLSIILIAAIITLFRSIFVFREEADKLGIRYNSFNDLYNVAVTFFLLLALRYSSNLLLKPLFVRRLKEVDQLNFDLKKDKVAKEFLSMLWYIFATTYGYIALHNHPYIPSWLLGSGTCDGLLREYGRLRGDELIRNYYTIQSAHHIYSLFDHLFITQKREDFSEMALHHLCTVAAIFFSYYTNQLALGATILLIHDVGDIFLNLFKIFRDMKLLPNRPKVLDVIALLLFCTWFFPRVVLINTCVIPVGTYTRHFDETLFPPEFQDMKNKMFLVDILQITLVFVIMLLNLWWSGIIVMTAYRKLRNTKGSSYIITIQGEKAK